MKFFTPFRLAAYLLLIFCVLHTAGGMLSGRSLGQESDAVVHAMQAVRVTFGGSTGTWYGFWFGFGMMVSVFLLFSATVAWQLGNVAPEQWSSVAVIAWALVLSQLATSILSFQYFFAAPGVFALLAALCIAWGAIQKTRAGREASSVLRES